MQFYCYVYCDENWQAYYVGKGQDRRRQQRHNVVIPDESQIQTFYFDHEWQAWECEIELIAFWKRKVDGGVLQNVSTGGAGGTSGYKHSPEALEKIAASSKKLWQDPAYRKRLSGIHSQRRHTEETKEKMSESAKRAWAENPGRISGDKNPMFGKKHSEETRAKMRAAKAKRKQKQQEAS